MKNKKHSKEKNGREGCELWSRAEDVPATRYKEKTCLASRAAQYMYQPYTTTGARKRHGAVAADFYTSQPLRLAIRQNSAKLPSVHWYNDAKSWQGGHHARCRPMLFASVHQTRMNARCYPHPVAIRPINHTMHENQVLSTSSSTLIQAIQAEALSSRAMASYSCLTMVSHVDHGTSHHAHGETHCGSLQQRRAPYLFCSYNHLRWCANIRGPGSSSPLRAGVESMSQPYGRLLLLVCAVTALQWFSPALPEVTFGADLKDKSSASGAIVLKNDAIAMRHCILSGYLRAQCE